MCIIAISRPGEKQPGFDTIRTMFRNNPHGAGYMYARDGKVIIHKGFMDIDSYLAAISAERFRNKDSVVYHFRISTQAGVNPEMTHPFPLSNQLRHMEKLDLQCQCGIAHNGIIRLTSVPWETDYSDTALFITNYLTRILRKKKDLHAPEVLKKIYAMAQSKFAILDGSGYIATVGDFIEEDGILYSNTSFLPRRYIYR